MSARRVAKEQPGITRHGMRTLEELLLKLGLGDLDLDSFVDLLLVALLVVGIVLDGSGEKRVNEGGLAQPGLASNLNNRESDNAVTNAGVRDKDADHDGEGGTLLGHNLVPLVGQIGNANRRGALSSCGSHLLLRTSARGDRRGAMVLLRVRIKNLQLRRQRAQLMAQLPHEQGGGGCGDGLSDGEGRREVRTVGGCRLQVVTQRGTGTGSSLLQGLWQSNFQTIALAT